MRNPSGNIYYGWWVLGSTVFAQFVSTSTGSMVSGVFLEPLVEDLGTRVWQFAPGISCATALGGGAVFMIGPTVYRFRVN